MSITAQQRTMILAAVAALGVGGVALDAVLRSKDAPAPSASPAPGAASTVAVLPGAPPGDLDELRKRYRPIVLKGPFKTRDFKPRRVRPRETPRKGEPKPEQPRKPGDLLLRLTSFLGHGAARIGLFEDRGSGTALFAKPGETLAGVAVKSVESERVVVLLAGKERAYGIGETLTLPASARGALQPLRPAGSVKTESKRYTGTTKLPELSEKKKLSILERLKARRRASRLRAEGKSPEEPTQDESKEDESKEDEPKQDAPKQDAPKQGDPKQGDPKQGDPKQPEPAPEDGPEGPEDGPEGPEGSDDPEGPPDEGSPGEPAGDEPNDEPNDEPDPPADDAPEGGEPSEDDSNDSSAPKSEPSPQPESEDNQ